MGDTVIFIGELRGGSTYTVEHWLGLFPDQWEVEMVQIPQRPCIHDIMLICRRKRS